MPSERDMSSTDLTTRRQNAGFWYFVINAAATMVIYCIPDSLVYEYMKHGEYHFLLAAHLLHIVCMLAYYTVSFADPGYVAYLSSSHSRRPFCVIAENIDDTALSPAMSHQLGSFCAHCQFIRPLQSKHCKICQRCIIQFDHHCGWINNCVGYKNRKIYLFYIFTQFLITLYALYASVHSLYLRNVSRNEYEHRTMTLWSLFQCTPIYLFYAVYKHLFILCYQLLFDARYAHNTFAMTLMKFSRLVLFIGMLVAVIFSAMLGAWNVYLVLTNQTTYAIYIRQKYGNMHADSDSEIADGKGGNDEKEDMDKKHPKRVLAVGMQRCAYLCCHALPRNIKAFCCDEMDDKYITAQTPVFI